jgi:hypothetical protein
LGNSASLPKFPKDGIAAAEHATDFDPPIYNIWKQKEKTSGSSSQKTQITARLLPYAY